MMSNPDNHEYLQFKSKQLAIEVMGGISLTGLGAVKSNVENQQTQLSEVCAIKSTYTKTIKFSD